MPHFRGVDIWQIANVITLLVTMASAGHVWSWHSEQRRAYPTLSGIDQRMCWLNLRAAQLFGIAFLMVFGLGCYELWQGHLVDVRGTTLHPARSVVRRQWHSDVHADLVLRLLECGPTAAHPAMGVTR